MGGLQLRSSLRIWPGRCTRALLVVALAFASGLTPSVLQIGSAALADGACQVWSTYTEADGKAENLTATACASTPDDSSAVGLQCLKQRPQLRYYPGDGAQDGLADRSYLDVSFVVDGQTFIATMRYDAAVGVFTAGMSRNEPLLQMLQSGGPLDVSSDTLGTHRFRLLGSTAAIAAVMQQCGVKRYIGPPPPTPPDDPAE